MLAIIFGVLLLYMFQSYLHHLIMLKVVGFTLVKYTGGPRDEPLELTLNAGRAKRAMANLNEAIIVFLPLALLSVHFGLNEGLAWWGAVVFLLARIAYVPAYIIAYGLTRSAFWTLGHIGLGMMAVALWKGA